MIKEAIELIQETAVQSKAAQKVDGLNLRNRALIDQQGKLIEQAFDPPARAHKVNSLETLATLLEGRDDASVWHCADVVTALLNDADTSFRDDKVTWALSPSQKFTALIREAQQPRPHADFVRWLVQNLRDEFEAAAPGLLGTIRNLKFRSADEQTGNVQQGRETMSRAIEAEITGAKELPETVLINVRRWASLEYVATVECLLVLDTTERRLSFKPLADQLERAENGAQDWLDGQLTGVVKCPVHYGTP